MGQQLRRAVGRVKEVEKFPSRLDRRSLPKEELSAGKSPSINDVSGIRKFSHFYLSTLI